MLLLLAVLVLGGAACLRAQNVEQPLAMEAGGQLIEGRLDWTNNVLIAYGEAVAPEEVTNPVQRRLLGFRAAKVVAYRNLLELAGQVHVDAQTTVGNLLLASDSIRTRISGIVQGAHVLPASQTETQGLYRIALRLELLNDFADAVLPPSSPSPPGNLPLVSGEGGDSLVVFVPPEPYTGLLIDARGLELQPSMSPRVLGADGRVVYSAAAVERSYATRFGLVGYDKDFDRARKSDRLGGREANPLIIKAQSASGLYRSDAVLSAFDAVRVAMADMDDQFLGQCRVMFVVGPEPAVADSSLLEDAAHQGESLELPEQVPPGHRPE
jgi:hypothetical protein